MGIYDMNSCNAETYIVKKLKNNKDTIILEFILLNDFTKYTNIPTYNVALQIFRKKSKYYLFQEHIHSGSGDITSLLLAKEMLTEFEEDYLSGKINKTQAEQLTKLANIPFGFLFLKHPPKLEKPTLPDFRTVQNSDPLTDNFYDVLQDTLDKAEWYKDYLRNVCS